MSLTSSFAAAKTAYESLVTESPDRCTVYSRTEAPDGFGGLVVTETAVASNIPIIYEERSDGTSQVAGGPLSYITHDLYLIPSSATRVIASDYKIVVAARADMPALMLEQPVLLEETFGISVHLGAKVKK